MENVMTNGFAELSEDEINDLNGGSLGECIAVFAGGGIGAKIGGYVGGTFGGPIGGIVGTAAGYGIYHLCDYLF